MVIDIPGFWEEVQDGDKRAQQRFFAQHPVGLPIAYQGGKEGGGLYAAKFQGGAFLSITDLAEACHVSLTSVFRFCKVLKLQGYQEFKVQLALSIREEGQDEEIELLPAAVTKADSVPTVAKKLLQSHINALSETHALVDEAALSRAAHYINHSDQVRFFGVGGSMLTAMEECINSCTLCQTFTACPISTCRQWAPPR